MYSSITIFSRILLCSAMFGKFFLNRKGPATASTKYSGAKHHNTRHETIAPIILHIVLCVRRQCGHTIWRNITRIGILNSRTFKSMCPVRRANRWWRRSCKVTCTLWRPAYVRVCICQLDIILNRKLLVSYCKYFDVLISDDVLYCKFTMSFLVYYIQK